VSRRRGTPSGCGGLRRGARAASASSRASNSWGGGAAGNEVGSHGVGVKKVYRGEDERGRRLATGRRRLRRWAGSEVRTEG
jgi:hypothetical protein